jgi:hypothetical protein
LPRRDPHRGTRDVWLLAPHANEHDADAAYAMIRVFAPLPFDVRARRGAESSTNVAQQVSLRSKQ